MSLDWNLALKELFAEYTSSGGRATKNYLTVQKLQQLLADAELPTSGSSLELMFLAETKHRPHMSLDSFMNLLPSLAETQFPEEFQENPKAAMSRLLDEHIFPLYRRMIESRSSYQQDTAQLSADIRDIFKSVAQPLKDLYKVYFPWESAPSMKTEMKLARSQKALHCFLKDFDICPSLVSKPTVFKVWNTAVLNTSEQVPTEIKTAAKNLEEGTCLSFTKFLHFLYLCAVHAYAQDPQLVDCPPAEKLLILLERMELARENLNASNHRPQTSRHSILPNKKLMDRIIYGMSELSVQEAELLKPSSSELNLDAEGMEYLKEQMSTLHQIFQIYCSFGEPMNTTRLKSAKLIKMLRDCHLLRDTRGPESFEISTSRMDAEGLSKVDVDLIFSKLTGSYANNSRKKPTRGFNMSLQSSNSYGRMEFQEFLKALEMICEKVYPGQALEEAYKALLEDYILHLDEDFTQTQSLNSEYTQALMDLLADPSVIEILGTVHQVMAPFFLQYADTRNMMSFTGFMSFCKDFAIFPEIVGKSKLMKFFYTLAGIQARTDESRHAEQTEFELIDQHLFIEALALIASEINHTDSQLTALHRICYLMERMSECAGKKPAILIPFLEKYPEILAHKNEPARLSFADLMS